jgi:prepilin-type N-terminal cleavage/methylation domain-containing protein
MRLDRILIDIANWIKGLLYQKQAKAKAFIVLDRRRSPFGDLCLVERDTPRAIRTYVFMPHRGSTPKPQQFDLHLCLDTLSPLDKAKEASTRPHYEILRVTHKITILWASHWLNADGTYDLDVIHEGFYDLQGQSLYEHKQAIATLDDLAALLLHQPYPEIDWAFEIDASRKLHVVGSWGFTLVESLMVVVVIGILAAIAIPSYILAVDKAKESEGRQLLAYGIRIQQRHFIEHGQFADALPLPENIRAARYRLEMDVEPDSVDVRAVPLEPRLEVFEREIRVCDLLAVNPELTLTEGACD